MNRRTLAVVALLSLAMALIGVAPANAQSAYQTAVTALSPSGYWPLQETVLPPAAHIETNIGSLGPVANAYYSSTNAVPGFAGATGDGDPSAYFNGAKSGAFLAVPTPDPRVSVPVGPFTVEAWVYPTNIGAGANTIVSQTGPSGNGGLNASTNSAGWSLNQNYIPSQNSSALMGWSFHVFNGVGPFGGAEAVAVISGTAWINAWYHIVGVFDGTNAYLYIDGTNASAPFNYQIPISGSYVRDTWSPLTIGCGRGFNQNQYYGFIDEVAIYTNALSATQVGNHFAAVANPAGPTSYYSTVTNDNPYMYWRMDAPAPPTQLQPLSAYPVAADPGSSGVVGVYLSGTAPGVSGPAFPGFGSPSYACAFNGIGTDSTNTFILYTNGIAFGARPIGLDSGVVITNVVASLNQTNTPMSAMVWFKANPADVRFQGLLGHSDQGWRLALDGGASGHPGTVHWNQGAGAEITSARTNYNDGNWHFAVGVYTNGGTTATGTNYLYVDGVLDSAIPATGTTVSTTNAVLIGGSPDYVLSGNSGYNQRFFSGSLTHAAYFNYALSAAQVQALYTAAQPTTIAIVVQPAAPSTNYVSGTNTLTVAVSGASPLGYEWFFNSSSNYSGATQQTDAGRVSGSATASFTIANLQSSDTGYYYMVATNASGSVTSILSHLTINPNPSILAQVPGGPFTAFAGQNYMLSVTAAGVGPLTYQWYTNGTPDTTAGTGAAYSLTGVLQAMSGNTYQCVVTDAGGSATNTLSTLTVQAQTNNYVSAVLALKPNGYWPMHEVATPAPGDIETNLGSLSSLGNAYYGDWISGNVTAHQTPGALGGDPDPAVTFSGQAGSYAIVPHTSPLATIKAPFTVECWIKPYNSKSYSVLVGQGGASGLNGSANLGGFALQWSGTPNTFSMVLWNGNGSGNYEQKTTAVYPAGVWYHVVSTFDGTNVAYYINSQLATFGVLQSGGPGPMSPDTWSPLVIGAGRWGGSGAAQPFAGEMDEVAIYTNLLQQSDITTHYNDGISGGPGVYKTDVLNNNPLVYYRMNAPAYTLPPGNTWPVLQNYGSVGRNGVYSPGTMVGGASGPSESGFPIANLGAKTTLGNGMASYADAGIDPTYLPFNYTSFSYTAWFKGIPADDRSFQGIMSANDGTWRSTINSAGKVQAHGLNDVTSPLAYNDGNWHQMVMTMQGNPAIPNGTNTLYIDGQPVISSVSTAATQTNSAVSSGGPEVFLGDEAGLTNNPVGPGRSFAGSVCEAAFFYGTVLSSNQVQNLWNVAGVPPFITKQPISASVNEGALFTNAAAANGSAVLAYQWFENGAPLGGQTGPSLILNPVLTGNNSTNYYLVVTNNSGAVTSAVVSLTVFAKPVVLSQLPVPYTNLFTLYAGVSPTFSVLASGAAPLAYRWYTNGVQVPGATTNRLTLTNIQVGSLTNYCIITNASGAATTTVWQASVVADPTAPYPQAVLALHPISYWRLNQPDDSLGDGNPGAIALDYAGGEDGIYSNTALAQLPGYNNNLTDPETCARFGFYASTNCGASTIQGIDFAAPSNTSPTFTVEAWVNGLGQSSGLGSIISKGYFNNEEFSLDCGAPNNSYRFEARDVNLATYNANSTQPANDGVWHHLVGVCDQVHSNIALYLDGAMVSSIPMNPGSGIAGNSNSTTPVIIGVRPTSATTGNNNQFFGYINDVAIFNYALSSNQAVNEYLSAGIAPRFTQEPVASTNVSDGATLIIPVGVIGTAPMGLQWSDSFGQTALLASQTNATLVITGISSALNGDTFTLTATNQYGTNASTTVTVNVISGVPVIAQDISPVTNIILFGSSATFVASANGTFPLSYSWLFNGNPLPNSGRFVGANSNSLTINNVQLSDSGTYQLVITNTFGSTNSSLGTLVVVPVLGFNENGSGWYSHSTVANSLQWLGNNALQLTSDLGNEDGAAFYSSPVYVGAFLASYDYQVPTGSSASADGITFCLQNDPRGDAALGTGGGGLGVTTPSPISPSVEWEYNIFAGNGVGGIGVSLDQNGAVGPVVAPGSIVLNSGDTIHADITYEGGTFSVTMTDTTLSTQYSFSSAVNIPAVLGTSTAFVGFTGADGGSKSTQIVSNFTYVPLIDLTIQESNQTAVIIWPTGAGAYFLQRNNSLRTTNWVNVTNIPATINGQNQVVVPATNSSQFYRLQLQ